ncbi:MAG: S-layer family protein [Iphinoe sp. HA4291-MV1]|jgi:filamentous hemagglutinin family protein|nr:S-layer family protein [Iphinoe sp. HA4291-MV1]
MSGISTRLGWFLGVAISIWSANCANAQITPDGTLLNNSSVQTEGNTSTITGGTKAGSNLFHSFREFSVPTGGTAYFNNALDIQNIISRVTGKSISNIDGLIKANGTANLFVINPNGIIFGQNARLDIGGSFVATTASAIGFGNQGFFSADAPNTPELLTVNPSAFFFNQIAAAPIQNNSVAPAKLASEGFNTFGLRVPDGKSLLLLGGDISMDGGSLNAFGGRVELGGLAGAGTVGLNVDGFELSLSFPTGVQWTDVSFSNNSRVNVRAGGGGSIAIHAQNLNMARGSRLQAGINSGSGFIGSQAGDIKINATEAINLTDKSLIFNTVEGKATGNGGNIVLKTRSLALSNGAQVGAITLGKGNAGSVIIQADDLVSLVGLGTAIFSSVEFGYPEDSPPSSEFDTSITGVGDSGGVAIRSRSLSLADGAQIVASTFAVGNAGNVSVRVDDSVSLRGGSLAIDPISPQEVLKVRFVAANLSESGATTGIFSTVESGAKGNAGHIEIQSRSLTLTNGAEVQSLTRGEGKAGNIRVNASDSINIYGVAPTELAFKDFFEGFSSGLFRGGFSSGLITSSEKKANGQGGDISVKTGALRLLDGAVLSARTRSNFRGGDITVNANTLEMTNGGQFLTSTFSSGSAGDITINATDKVSISESDSTFAARREQVNEAVIDNDGPNSGLFARVRGDKAANAGNIKVTARSISLDKQGTITTETTLGEGGDITLKLRNILLLRNNSGITATAGTQQAGGNGGNITIDTPNGFIVAVPNENSDITANAFTGKGGRVQINASGIYGTQFREKDNPQTSDITASSEFGVNGTVELNTPDIDLNSGLVNLPSVPVDTKLAQGCDSPNYAQSSFIITGRGGLPPNPKDILTPDAIEVDWVTLNPDIEKNSRTNISIDPPQPTPEPIVEATGWVFNEKGQVVFTADATPHGSWQKPVSCHAS